MADNELEFPSIAHYELQSRIGKGSMGTVYQAVDMENGRSVAVKILFSAYSQREEYLAQLQETVTAVTQLNHPAIAPVFETGSGNKRTYQVVPYFSGGTFEDKLAQSLRKISTLLHALSQIATALDAAHAIGIAHKDVKPSNILFDENGDAFIMDFGIIQIMEMTMHALGLPGTLTYMSPEQFTDAHVGSKADQYSLAIIAYELLTGTPPFTGNMAQLMYKHVHEPVPVADLPAEQAEIFQRALAKESADRFESTLAFITALQKTIPPVEAPEVAREPEESSPMDTLITPGVIAAGISQLDHEVTEEDHEPDAASITTPPPATPIKTEPETKPDEPVDPDATFVAAVVSPLYVKPTEEETPPPPIDEPVLEDVTADPNATFIVAPTPDPEPESISPSTDSVSQKADANFVVKPDSPPEVEEKPAPVPTHPTEADETFIVPPTPEPEPKPISPPPTYPTEADKTFIVPSTPEPEPAPIAPSPPPYPATADETFIVEPTFSDTNPDDHFSADPGATFVVDPRSEAASAAWKQTAGTSEKPEMDPSMTFVISGDEVRQQIVSGAGGETTAPKEGGLKAWHIGALVGVVLLVLLFAALFMWQRSRSTTPSETEIVAEESAIPVIEGPVIHFADPTADMAVTIGGEAVSMSPAGQVPVPEDQPIRLEIGHLPVTVTLSDTTSLMLEAGTKIDVRQARENSWLLFLRNGRLVTTSENLLTVLTPLNAEAQLTSGMMGVGYQESPFVFEVDCFAGECAAEDLDMVPLTGGKGTGIGENGKLVPPEPAHHENYGFAPVIATATATSTATATATSTPTIAATDPIDTATPTPSATPTLSPTVTATFVPRPRPVILNLPCNAPTTFNRNDTIFFEWSWTGQLRGDEYLEVRVGPQGATNLTSVGRAPQDFQQGNNWRMPVAVSIFFKKTALDYHWEVVHMHGNGTWALARSQRGCFHVNP